MSTQFKFLNCNIVSKTRMICATPYKCFENIPFISGPNFIRIKCSNKNCNSEKYMHSTCFYLWEENIIKQIHNYAKYMPIDFIARNIWNSQHFNLNIPICQCKCRSGHLRIDDKFFIQNASIANTFKSFEGKRFRNESNSSLSLSSFEENANSPVNISFSALNPIQNPKNFKNYHYSSDSIDDSSGVFSMKNDINNLQCNNSLPEYNFTDNSSVDYNSYKSTAISLQTGLPYIAPLGCKFSNRTDFNCFNFLPRSLINSYHIKMEDEGPHGNDEIRFTLLSKFSSMNMNSINCVFCGEKMEIFDRYPLIDGIFFLSPINYYNTKNDGNLSPHKTPINEVDKKYLEIKLKLDSIGTNSSPKSSTSTFLSYDMMTNQSWLPNIDSYSCNLIKSKANSSFLNALCSKCSTATKLYELIKQECNHFQFYQDIQNESSEGNNNMLDIFLKIITCSFCQKPWDGSKFTIGTLYSYDIFNSIPCCRDRLSCKTCCNLISPDLIKDFQNETMISYPSNDMLLQSMYTERNYLSNNNERTWPNQDSFLTYLTCSDSDLDKQPSVWSNRAKNSFDFFHSSKYFFSYFSKMIECPYCNTCDYHFIKKDRHDVVKIQIPSQIVSSLLLN